IFPPVAASESLRRIKASSHRLGQFRFVLFVGQSRNFRDCHLAGEAPALQNVHAAGGPSFSAFAFNNRANAVAGSLNKRTRRGAGDKSSPSNGACKISRAGKSARVFNSDVESTARSTKPTLSAANLNSVANVLKILETGATSVSPVTTAVCPPNWSPTSGKPESAIASLRKLFLTTCTSPPAGASRLRNSLKLATFMPR